MFWCTLYIFMNTWLWSILNVVFFSHCGACLSQCSVKIKMFLCKTSKPWCLYFMVILFLFFRIGLAAIYDVFLHQCRTLNKTISMKSTSSWSGLAGTLVWIYSSRGNRLLQGLLSGFTNLHLQVHCTNVLHFSSYCLPLLHFV